MRFFAAVKKEELRSHMETVHRDGDYQCGECDGDHQCYECDFAAVNHRDGDYQCDECDFAAVKREELKSHLVAVHRDGDYQCDECDVMNALI